MTNNSSLQLDLDAEELYETLSQLVHVYQFRDRDRTCDHDISVTQCYAIETLVKQGPLRLQALAKQLFLNKSSVSRLVDSLEHKGYLERTVAESDRRGVFICVTAAGLVAYNKIRSELIAEERGMIENIPPEIRQGIVALLKKITHATELRCGVVVGGGGGDCDPAPCSGGCASIA